MNKLYKPTKLNTLHLKNHFFVPPMVTYAADENGRINHEQQDHYIALAQGGFGMITLESHGILNEAEKWALFSKTNEDAYPYMIKRMQKYGSKVGIQINNSISKTPAHNGVSERLRYIKSLSNEYLEKNILGFVEMAKRAESLGFDYIEVHGAHTYLLDSLFTTREDNRTLEERMKYHTKLLNALFDAINIPIGIRISTWWETEDGELIDLTDDYVRLLTPFKSKLEYISISTSGYRKGEYYNFVPADQFKEAMRDVKIITASGVNDLDSAMTLGNKVDLVGIGSAAMIDKNILYKMCPSRNEMHTLNDKFSVMGRMIVNKK